MNSKWCLRKFTNASTANNWRLLINMCLDKFAFSIFPDCSQSNSSHRTNHTSCNITDVVKQRKGCAISLGDRRELNHYAHMNKTWQVVEILHGFNQENANFVGNWTCKFDFCWCSHANVSAWLHQRCITTTAECDGKEANMVGELRVRLEWLINRQLRWTSWFIHNRAIVVDVSDKSPSSTRFCDFPCNGLNWMAPILVQFNRLLTNEFFLPRPKSLLAIVKTEPRCANRKVIDFGRQFIHNSVKFSYDRK